MENFDIKVRSTLPQSYTTLMEENENEAVTMAVQCPAPQSISLLYLSEKSSVVLPLTELFGMFVNKSSYR